MTWRRGRRFHFIRHKKFQYPRLYIIANKGFPSSKFTLKIENKAQVLFRDV